MNISKAARNNLIILEQVMKSQPIEYACQLDSSGNLLSCHKGTAFNIVIPYIKDDLILTHNHPKSFFKNNFLSPADLICAVKNRYKEVRSITSDGFCHLVEIPPKGLSERKNCLINIVLYEHATKKFLDRGEDIPIQMVRKIQKILKKSAGLKFRTIKLPAI